MRTRSIAGALLPLAVLGLALALAAPALGQSGVASVGHYVPRAGDSLAYSEEIVLDNGVGNYTGYTEHDFINGSISVGAISTNGNGSVATHYASTGNWSNNQGQSQFSGEHGWFGFSYQSYLYVNGTDNQTGYTNPFVWFYVNNTVGVGGSVTLLNSPLTVDAVAAAYPMASSPTGYVVTIRAEGNGSYQRNDIYGVFTATYTWIAYFDPSTGYIVGYQYTEQDSSSSGGFTWTDTLTDTHTSFPLTAASAPPPPSSSSSGGLSETLVVVLVVVVVVVIALVVVLAVRSRRRSRPGLANAALPQHAAPGAPPFRTTFQPPPVNLVPSGQPAVQQIVIRETVKVPCAYCGTLMDSTATVCPKCGAPRT